MCWANTLYEEFSGVVQTRILALLFSALGGAECQQSQRLQG
jgi:hypothetical protein